MKNLKNRVASHLEDLNEFIQSTDFAMAMVIGISVVAPIFFGVVLNQLQIGITISIGALLASPSDVSGNISVKLKGLALATLLSMLMTFFGSLIGQSMWVLFPVLGILMFAVSYLSIFGFRASMISFSGLLALIISLSSMSSKEHSLLMHICYIGVGGLFYILLSYIRHLLFPKGPVEHFMMKAFKLTAEYLETRGELIDAKNDRTALTKKLMSLQIELTDTHETLREMLIRKRRIMGKSGDANRKLLVFVQLVDMLELAMGTPVNYNKTDQLFAKNQEALEDFQQLLQAMSVHLVHLSSNRLKPTAVLPTLEMDFYLKKIQNDIEKKIKVNQMIASEDELMLVNYLKYQKIQVDKLKKIERLVQSKVIGEQMKPNRERMQSILSNPSYEWSVLIDNFNFESPVFKHSLRLAVASIIGYGIGITFELQNPYWILLTLLVILRPSYGLTKDRAIHRTVGTIIGGVVAFGIILVTDNKTLYGILAAVSLVISFAMMQRNYKAATTFVTLNVVFMFALIEPNIFDVIHYRILDTVIGVGVATFANLLLWPAWEVQTIENTLKKSLKCNNDYLQEIAKWYNVKGEVVQELKVKRKRAFIAMSDLSASFQRMAQEPRSQQNRLNETYQLVLNSQLILTSVASLSTFIANHKTTPASSHFNQFITCIVENLNVAVARLDETSSSKQCSFVNSEELMEDTFGSQINATSKDEVEEAYLIIEQLKWLYDLSVKTIQIIPELQDNE